MEDIWDWYSHPSLERDQVVSYSLVTEEVEYDSWMPRPLTLTDMQFIEDMEPYQDEEPYVDEEPLEDDLHGEQELGDPGDKWPYPYS